MWRILGAGALLAAIVVGWLVFGQSAETGESAGAGKAGESSAKPAGSKGAGDPSKQAEGATMPAPLRMSSDNPEATGAQSPVAAADSLAESFAREEVDKDFAETRGAMIREVTEQLITQQEGGAELKELDCRSRHCLLKIAGDDQKSVVALVDALQDERGFFGKAESLMMSRDGDEIHMYLRFVE